jgi:hypothetical protein
MSLPKEQALTHGEWEIVKDNLDFYVRMKFTVDALFSYRERTRGMHRIESRMGEDYLLTSEDAAKEFGID